MGVGNGRSPGKRRPRSAVDGGAQVDGYVNSLTSDALWIASTFLRSNSPEWLTVGDVHSCSGRARVRRIRPGRILLVVGDSDMATALRNHFGRGLVPSWSLQPMPETRTPLDEYRDARTEDAVVVRRCLTHLAKAGFAY